MDARTNSSMCVSYRSTRFVFVGWFIMYLLLMLVFLFVLYVALTKWRRPQSSAAGGLSHSDVFTLHMIAMEMFSIITSCITLFGFFHSTTNVTFIAMDIFTLTFTGQMLFHTLTCVERYLAVVHPVIYLRLRKAGGVTIRNSCIAFVWSFSTFFFVIFTVTESILVNSIYGLVLILPVMAAVLFCSVRVLSVLMRPKPGAGANTKGVTQSKRTTVYTMITILGVLLMRLLATVLFYCIDFLLSDIIDTCLVGVAANWLSLPSSLVLPFLFLHRAGKLPGKARK